MEGLNNVRRAYLQSLFDEVQYFLNSFQWRFVERVEIRHDQQRLSGIDGVRKNGQGGYTVVSRVFTQLWDGLKCRKDA